MKTIRCKHYHIIKQSRGVGHGKSMIEEHMHAIATFPHEHGGMTGCFRTLAEAERERDAYDARIDAYRARLRKGKA